jgi:cbb3-type cytochrome oxidase maturation protein
MDILYLLIPVSVVLVFVIGIFFWKSVRGGQFEDLEGPAYRILMDDDRAVQPVQNAAAQAETGRSSSQSGNASRVDPHQ